MDIGGVTDTPEKGVDLSARLKLWKSVDHMSPVISKRHGGADGSYSTTTYRVSQETRWRDRTEWCKECNIYLAALVCALKKTMTSGWIAQRVRGAGVGARIPALKG